MSHRLDLDYVDHQTLSFSRWSGWTVLLCLLGLLIAFFVVKHYQTLQQEYDQVASTLSESDKAVFAKKEASRVKNKQTIPAKELKEINETVSVLSTPWDKLLVGLEAINMKSVALLLLEPNKQKKQVVLTGQAKNVQFMLRYVEEVSKLPMLSEVYLQNHMIELDEPNKPVNFTVMAHWN